MAKILVIEDETSNADVIMRFVEQFGHEVKTAWSAEGALAELEGSGFDVILLDIMLPGMSGLSCFQAIRKVSQAPVIAMSGFSDENYKEQSLKLGAVAFLPKPIDFKMLELALVDVLAQK